MTPSPPIAGLLALCGRARAGSGKAFTTCRIADNFFSVIAFDDVTEELAKLGKKGSTIVIVGRLKSRSYEKDGQKRQSVDQTGCAGHTAVAVGRARRSASRPSPQR